MNKLAEAVRNAAHSPLGPSSADRWINCPGSVLFTLEMPEEVSEFAVEGNGAHDVLERCLKENLDPYTLVGGTTVVTEQGQDYEIDIDDEMADSIDVVVKDVAARVAQTGGQLLVERRVVFDRWVVHGFGTLDITILMDGTAEIDDFKYGKGVEVLAENNTQMKIYALGILQQFGHLYEITGFKLKIHQPRIDNFSDWYISVEDLVAWADEVLVPAARRALEPGAPLKAGYWCSKNFCKARFDCRVRAEWLMQEAMEPPTGELTHSFEDLTAAAGSAIKHPDQLSLEQLATVGPMLDSLSSWVKDVRKRIISELGKGNEVGGMKMVEGRSTRVFSVTDELAVEQMTKAGIPEEECYEKKLLSPAKADKKIKGKGSGERKKILAKVVHKPPGKPKLVCATDPRPALTDLTNVFAALEDDSESEE